MARGMRMFLVLLRDVDSSLPMDSMSMTLISPKAMNE